MGAINIYVSASMSVAWAAEDAADDEATKP